MSHKRSMNVPQAAENAIKGTRVYPGPKVGRRRALLAVFELLLYWLVSRTQGSTAKSRWDSLYELDC